MRRNPLLLLTTLLLSLPLLLRFIAGHPIIPGASSYAHLTSLTHPYDLLLSLLTPLGLWTILLSTLLGLCSIALLYQLVTFRSARCRTFTMLLFIINPLFLSTFTSLSPLTLALPLALLALLSHQKSWRAAFLLTTLLTTLFAPLLGLLIPLLLLTRVKERRLLFIALLTTLLAALLTLFAIGLSPLEYFSFSAAIAEFGKMGLSLFLLSLALIGGVQFWRKERALFSLFLLITIGAFFNPTLLLASGMLAIPFAALLITQLSRRSWRLPTARLLVLLLILCSLLFLLLSHTITIAHQQPREQLVSVLNAAPPGAILSPTALRPVVEYYTGSPTVPLSESIEELYTARRLSTAEVILEEQSIHSLLITQEMRSGAVWNRDDEGLLFLMPHSGHFSLLAQNEQAELWEYTP